LNATDSWPQLHPRNTCFKWPDTCPRGQHGSADEKVYRRITPEQAEQFDSAGYFVITDAFNGATVRHVTKEIDQFEAVYENEASCKSADKRTAKDDTAAALFMPHLVTVSPYLRRFCASAIFCDLAWDLLGPSVRVYWDQAVYKKSEHPREFPWHQDNGRTYIEPQNYLTCWLALSEATLDNGCLWMLPGRHLWGMLDHEDTEDGLRCRLEDTHGAVPLEVSPGALVVFSSLTPHRSGPNQSATKRKALIIQYALDNSTVFRDSAQGIPYDLVMNDPLRQYLVISGGRPVPVDVLMING
jgi:phytanoyl-CoA hydroxylase